MVETARKLAPPSLPHLELEEGVLGRRSKSMARFLNEEAPEPLQSCLQRMSELSDGLDDQLGYRAVQGLQQVLFREPMPRGQRRALSPGPLTEEEVDRGYVAPWKHVAVP